MAYNPTSVFLNGLSSFWTRFFKDAPTMDALYRGVEQQMGQVYLDILESVLRPSLQEVSVFQKDKWRLILSDDSNTWGMEGKTALKDGVQIGIQLDKGLSDVKYIYAQLISEAPQVLEVNKDFVYSVYDGTPWLFFNVPSLTSSFRTPGSGFNVATRAKPPTVVGTGTAFASYTYATELPNAAAHVPHLQLTLIPNKFRGAAQFQEATISPASDTWFPFSGLPNVHEHFLPNVWEGGNLRLTLTNGRQVPLRILQTAGSMLYVTFDGWFSDASVQAASDKAAFLATHMRDVVSWELVSPDYVNQWALWIPDASVDHSVLADLYGYIVGQDSEVSSFHYKQLLRVLYRLYTTGATLANMESLLNIAAGIPVVVEDGEVIKALVPTGNVVTTKREYTIPYDIRRTDLAVGMTLRAFDSLTTLFAVKDTVSDPTWWVNMLIPEEILPDEDQYRRQSTPGLYEQRIGTLVSPIGTPLFKIGDPLSYIGYNDTGLPPTDTSPGSAPWRHSFAYNVLSLYLKNQIIGVTPAAASIPASFDATLAKATLMSSKPTYLFLYFAPYNQLSDRVAVSDSLTYTIR